MSLPPGRALTVSQLTARVKAAVEGAPELRDVWVEGEISNYKHHPSGHRYFSLKDEGSVVRAVLFERAAREQAGAYGPLPAELGDGLRVLAHGYVGVFPRAGQYQLYVDALLPAGVGSLHQAFEQLKAKLQAEGLFAADRKRPLPFLPRRLGVVTSPSGAAVRDVIRVARRRFPGIRILVVPVLVQGPGAPEDIVRGLAWANRPELGLDVIILGRGGGSLEELWAFNDERVVRAVAASRVPVVAAVGHETDVTLVDFAADVRAPTPSAGAELAVPDVPALRSHVDRLTGRLAQALRRRVREDRRRLELLRARLPVRRPLPPIAHGRQALDDLRSRLQRAWALRLARGRERLSSAAGRLEALSPVAVLRRGYAVARRPDGRVLRRAGDATVGDRVEVILAEGGLDCEVRAIGAGLDPAPRVD
ncbi:MAG: exodeoxyribonuclease VII large subunit [Clostridia bacterium]|nr:exodeoxyribonuclease VII large subunit [Clostridia bacterium]